MRSYAKVGQVDLPLASRLSSSYGRADFADAFSVDVPASVSFDAEALARHIFAEQPEWIGVLLRLRDLLVGPLGLKKAAHLHAEGGDRIGIFRVFERHADEIVLGEDDTHLDFRVSVLLQPETCGRARRLTVTTLVFYNRPLGRAYVALIAPFHRAVVRSSLDQVRTLG